jgi:hypothetical protein
MKIEYHQSIDKPQTRVVSISGLDVQEACDAYTAAELRSIARVLENIAENLDYSNSKAIQSTPFLFNTN